MARRSPLPAAALISAVLALGLFLAAGGTSHAPRQADLILNAAGNPSAPAEKLPPAPLAFEPAADGNRYLVRGTQYDLAVDARGTRLSGKGADIRTQLVGARTTRAAASHRQKLVVNRYQADVSRTGIPTFGRVTYPHVYRGIDLAYHGKGGALEYDFIVRPGADPRHIALSVSGADRVRIDAAGNLVASAGQAKFRQHRPIAYQLIGGKRHVVDASFVLDGNRARFALGRYDRTRPLVIDPTLTYSDYIGGARDDAATRVAVDSGGNVYVVGQTNSTSIQQVSGTRSGTDFDAFVLKIAPDHTRNWISYLGGTGREFGNDIGLDAQGRPYIVGTTNSGNFPGAGNSPLYGPTDSFTAAFDTSGSLRWAHTLGIGDTAVPSNPMYGLGSAIAVEGSGYINIALTGVNTDPYASSPTPPTLSYGIVTRYAANGTWDDSHFAYSDGAGNTGTSTVNGLGVKPGCSSDCDVFFTGHTEKSFTCSGNPVSISIAYVAGYNLSTSTPTWSGAGVNYYLEDCEGGVDPVALDVSHAGNPVIVGTDSAPDNTPVSHVFFARYNGANGTFDEFPFSTSVQAASAGFDVTHDAQDNFIIVGADSGSSGDMNSAIQPTYNGGFFDGTLVKIFPDGPPLSAPSNPGDTPHAGAAIVYATLFGGSATDQVFGVTADNNGNTYFTGYTISPSKFPTQNPTQSPGISGSLGDGFIGIIRPTLAQITGGPSGSVHSRDAKFTFGAGPEPGFTYSAEDGAPKFECKLTPRDGSFGACPANGYTGLGDGNYKFEVRAIDMGGTSGGAASREFQVDATLAARFSIAPNPALVGRPVTFDGSSSSGLPVTKYEWDLDGNGSFETDTGGTATATQTYPSAGSFNVGLRVTDTEGHTATTTNTLQVNNATGPGTQFGVTINKGAQFTNDPNVTVTATFPSFTSGLLFSNDGGFGKAQTFPAKKETAWKLDSSGPERLPKTIYVRFLTGSIASNSFQDDIILDETPPKVDAAEIDPVGAAGAGAGDARAAKLRKYKVKMKARDKTSGVNKVQVTANKRKPGKALKYKRKFTVKSAKRPKWVRARDRAGNWSKWKKAR
jgi:PKD domain/Beta-propeller repeat